MLHYKSASKQSTYSSKPTLKSIPRHLSNKSKKIVSHNESIKKSKSCNFFTSSKTKSTSPLSIPHPLSSPHLIADFSEQSQFNQQSNPQFHNTITSSLTLPYEFHQSTLSNGIHVVTHSQPFPVSHISLCVNQGSRYEQRQFKEQGLTHFMERSILRSTTNRITGTFIRDMAKLGADFSTSSSKESFTISATTPSRINPVLGALADIIKYPAFEDVDLYHDKHQYFLDSLEHKLRRDVLIHNTIQEAAWGLAQDGGLGQSHTMPMHHWNNLSSSVLQRWHKKMFQAKNITMGAVNVDHVSFVKLAEEMFGDIQDIQDIDIHDDINENIASFAPPTNTSSESHEPRNLHIVEPGYSGNTHLALYWPAASLKSVDIFTTSVFRQLMGSGAPFSQGGPGKGLHSRLQHFVNGHTWISNTEAFQMSYSDTGLFGVYSILPPDAVGYYLDTIGEELVKLQATITQEETNRAKNMLTSSYLTQLNSSLYRCEESARHVQLYGSPQFQNYLNGITNVKLIDLRNLAGDLFIQQQPNMVTFGNVEQIPKKFSFDHLMNDSISESDSTMGDSNEQTDS